ncbi:MAG: DUF438 domain-containing protein [Acidobacteria bacterium]|nr:MAG: DUF438 domain-containing protein [Acidobacteriota bacterium]
MSELIDNSRRRIALLEQAIRGLHEGEPVEAVKARLRELVGEASSAEIAAMEQQLMADGLPVEQVRALCDLHHEVAREIVRPAPLERLVPPGHPVAVFRDENRAFETALRRFAAETEAAAAGRADLPAWRAALEPLLEIEKHFARKENLLFPKLEAHGITAPSQVMWAKDDEIREMLAALRGALAVDDAAADEWAAVAETVARPLARQIEAMIDREERILLPLALEKLSEDDWIRIAEESPRFGWALIDPPPEWSPAGRKRGPAAEAPDASALPADGRVRVGVGSLRLDELRGILAVLPVDLTFVDRDDRVAFFSEGERIFARTPAVIGRKVHLCHPPRSVDVVERIIGAFRRGEKDVAEFWITLGGRFVHIRYFAVRDGRGEYLGTLEVTQDLTPLRALEGERRLLDWDENGDRK